MKEHPIIFSVEMVKAILDGRKTMTRRVINWKRIPSGFSLADSECQLSQNPCPYGQPGDRLWVKETWQISGSCPSPLMPIYKANECPETFKWRSAMFMPRKFSRITLEITDVRVERLQEISEKDAEAEGAHGYTNAASPIDFFIVLWNKINAKGGLGWETNPWVWVIEFKRVNNDR